MHRDHANEKGRLRGPGEVVAPAQAGAEAHSSGTISSATMLMILMSGFTAGPAVSL